VERSVDSTLFRQVLGHFATGVTVVSVMGEGPVGLAVGAFFSVSLDPPLVGFCVRENSGTWPLIEASDSFCVSVLGEEQERISRRFASSTIDRYERFDGVAWTPAPSGAPRLIDALAWIDCHIHAVHPAGDHIICVGHVNDMDVEREDGPLLFFRSGYGRFAP
jgi:3-hydroxy-9,10-secoandrosta-1,3,5(10)-triene-9,17-dione monooxygenase reductase component